MRGASLYVHFPFCKSKCAYCGFFSVPAPIISDDYLTCVENEARYYAELYAIDYWSTIYLGGGTPSLMSAQQIEHVVRSLKNTASAKEPDEITIEANPESLTADKLVAAASCGVRRLSLGVQSLSDGALKTARRACSAPECTAALDLARQKWQGDLCVDVIAGLPAQTRDEAACSLERILSFHPEHVSLYCLEIEEGTPFDTLIKQGKMRFDEGKTEDEWLWGREALLARGYSQYEVSNFCEAGRVSLHNLGYWRQKDYVGSGAGAVGTLYGSGAEASFRWSNTRDVTKYMAFWSKEHHPDETGQDEIPRDVELVDLKTREIEFLMMGLRTAEGVSSTDYKRTFSAVPPWYGDLAKRLSPLKRTWGDGICCTEGEDGQRWAAQGEAYLFLNRLLLDLMD